MAKMPDPWRSVVREIAALKKTVADLARRSPFYGTGMRPDGKGGVVSNGFDGDLATGNPGTKGWGLGDGRAAFGELILRPGSVGNDALTSPVLVEAVYDFRQNFALTTTLSNIRTKTVTVPAGFTKAAVSVTVRVFAVNPSTTGGYDTLGGDYLYGQANINGFNGFALPLATSGNGGSGTNVSPFSAVLDGLTPGSTISLQIAAQTAFANWAANVQNTAELSGSVQWFR